MDNPFHINEGIMRNIASQDDRIGSIASQEILKHCNDTIEPLIGLIGHPNPQVRYRIAWMLGKITDAVSLKVLVAMTMDRDERVSYDAFMALSCRVDSFAEEAILKIAPVVVSENQAGREGALMALNILRQRDSRNCQKWIDRNKFPEVWNALKND